MVGEIVGVKEIVGVLDGVTVGVLDEPSDGVAVAVPVIVGDVVCPTVELTEMVGVMVAVAVCVDVIETVGEMVGVRVELGEVNGDGVAVAVPVMVGVVVVAAQMATTIARVHEKSENEYIVVLPSKKGDRCLELTEGG